MLQVITKEGYGIIAVMVQLCGNLLAACDGFSKPCKAKSNIMKNIVNNNVWDVDTNFFFSSFFAGT